MEFQYSLIAALWLSTWLMVIYTIYFPAMQFLGQISPNNTVYRYRYINLFFFGAVTFVGVPLLVVPLVSKQHRLHFIKSYLEGILKNDS